MDQQAGWEQMVDAMAGTTVASYTYRYRAEPGTDSMFRRTARKKANRLNAKHIAQHGSPGVVYVAEKRKRGPFGWHVVRRTKVHL